ncbi:TPA: DUF1642 domain-containing protein [Streptococcus suis]|uniref:DUF1642 domain-containing protein n=1 Tax=Streptococcus suis TaxID=1307 RepID=UPI000CF5B9C8|nr:DUF1642 domain-containing protein [Streptococcus suis]HEL2312769.1 DUF1642 domain-containing protein [Streptococcus suis]HEL2505295.1 DUF1642 domain-containing protein [Streptococcus suis]HEM5137901.1 DUF1642 domain-containing protein [Streptococcus suis]
MNKQYKIGDEVLVRGIVNSEVRNGGIHVLHDGVDAFYILDQIHEPQKVVVPKFVAEWIEKCKDMNCSLRDAMKNTKLSAELNAWFLKTGQDMFTYPNQENFARAWLDGYEIDQEKLYVVTDGNKLYLKEFDELNAIIIIDDVVGAVDYAKRYEDKTKAQQAADELGWIVKEVE